MLSSNTDSLSTQMQNIANSIQSDVERQLNRSFNQFDVLEHQTLNDPENTSYYLKVKTDDNGHVKVKTTKHPAGGEWKTDVQEYDRGKAIEGDSSKALSNQQNLSSQGLNKPFGSDVSSFGSNLLFDCGFQSWQNLADKIKQDVEGQLNTSFKTFNVLEHEAKQDPEHTSFYMKVKTDDNGHVKIKTTKHPAGGEWKTNVQEFDRGKSIEGRGDRRMEVENKPTQTTYGTGQATNP